MHKTENVLSLQGLKGNFAGHLFVSFIYCIYTDPLCLCQTVLCWHFAKLYNT